MGSRPLDPHTARLAADVPAPDARLDVFNRTRARARRTPHRVRTRQGHRWFVVRQRDGLCPRPSRRLRPLGRERPAGLVLCQHPPLLPSSGILGGNTKRVPRQRWSTDNAIQSLRGPAQRCIHCGGGGSGPQPHGRLQRRATGRLRALSDDCARRQAMQRRGRLSAAGADTRSDRGRCQRIGHARADRRLAGRRHRISEGRRTHRRARRARGHSDGGRHQFTAAAHAVGHRRSRRASRARHRGECSAAWGRTQSTGPSLGGSRLPTQRTRPFAREDAT